MFKKVLIAAPTSKEKNYCFEEWLENVMSFTYPNFDVVLFDNTNDYGNNAAYLREIYRKKFGKQACRFQAKNSMIINLITSAPSNVIERMGISHNDCRDYAIKNNYDYMLSLETDVFPPKDVIEALMYHSKDVVGALYHRSEGIDRRLMIQSHIRRAPNDIQAINVPSNEDAYFVDGTLKKVAHVGLGCVLISRNALEKIKFRFVDGEFTHPDSFFAEDCFRNKIIIHADTSICCRHDNKDWSDEHIKHALKTT